MKKFYKIFNEGSVVNQVVCAVLINLPALAYGMSTGWMSPMILLLQSNKSPKSASLTETEVSWMSAAAYIFFIPGYTIMGYLCDTLGRKIALLFISAFGAASWVILLFSLEVWALITARVLVGLTMSGCYVLCPIYTMEISQESIQGILGCFMVLFQSLGTLLLYVIGDMLQYRTVLWICLSIPTFHLVIFMMMPESPSFLLKRADVEEATRVLSWLRCRREEDIIIKAELNKMAKEQKNEEQANRFLIKAILKDRILFKVFCITMVVTLSKELTGVVPVLNFAGEIFTFTSNETNFTLTPNQQTMLLGVMQVSGAILASIIINKFRRKILITVASLISGLSLIAFASWLVAKEYGVSCANWLPIMTLCLFIFCSSTGLQPISNVIVIEMFPYKYRNTIFAVTMSAASFADFLQLLFFKSLANSIGMYVAFYLFGVICMFITLYVLIIVPETKHNSIDQIYKHFGKRQFVLSETEML